MSEFHDHFSGASAEYAAFRPRYPSEFVAQLAARAPDRDIAWDCATGNGQAAVLIAQHFREVIATDASREQVANALKHPKVHYQVGREDRSGAPDESVSLVTVATALHWLDLDRFYGEARRVLKKDGVIAAWCYGFARINADIDAVNTWFGETRVGSYWPPQRKHVDREYKDLAFPFEEIAMGQHTMTASLLREEFIGYLGTWSSVARARTAEGVDPIPEVRERLEPLWPDDVRLDVAWPLYMRVGRV